MLNFGWNILSIFFKPCFKDSAAPPQGNLSKSRSCFLKFCTQGLLHGKIKTTNMSGTRSWPPYLHFTLQIYLDWGRILFSTHQRLHWSKILSSVIGTCIHLLDLNDSVLQSFWRFSKSRLDEYSIPGKTYLSQWILHVAKMWKKNQTNNPHNNRTCIPNSEGKFIITQQIPRWLI